MHKLSNKTKSTREIKPSSSSAEISTSADPDNQDRPSPSLGESRPDRPPRRPRNKKKNKGKTPEEIREKASIKLLRNREAAVEYVLGSEDEKNKHKKSSSRRRVVRVDSAGQLNEITMVLKEDDIRKEKITGAVSLVGSAKDDPKKQDELKNDATLVSLASEVMDGAKTLSSVENGQLHATSLAAGAGPKNVVDGEPALPPPELTLQRNMNGVASSAPGAFSVVPQARHRFRDILLRRTTSRRTTSRQNSGVESTAISRAAAATEPQAADVESLVSATLVPSVAVTDETTHHESETFSLSEACVVHAEGMSFWTFVKRNRKAQCGILVALLFFFGLITALASALSGSNNDTPVQVTAPVVDAVSPISAPIQGAALPATPPATPTPSPAPTSRPSTPAPTSTPLVPTKESCEGCSNDDNDDDGNDAPDSRN